MKKKEDERKTKGRSKEPTARDEHEKDRSDKTKIVLFPKGQSRRSTPRDLRNLMLYRSNINLLNNSFADNLER